MIKPVCSKCQFLTEQPVRFRPCAKIPIFHKNMLCTAEDNVIKDNVTGESYTPYCEEVNRHGECLAYKPVGLEKPRIIFHDDDNIVVIYGNSQFVATIDGSEPTSKLVPLGEFDGDAYVYEMPLRHSCTVKAACIIDGVLSEVESLYCEIPDIPIIEFDKSTNTVTIKSYNKVYFTVNGNKVTEDSPVYEGPFVIDHNTTVKARSYCGYELSREVSKYCVSIEPPVIDFDADTNKVSLSADDTILYSIDGSDIYDDSAVYDEPIELTKNTLVKAACIVDGELSETVELECAVANPPVVTYDEKTHKVSIESENPVHYTIDGSEVKKSSPLYSIPFAITETCTVKAASFTNKKMSDVTELECIFVSAPEITLDPETNTVSITGDYDILYSTDGSHIFDDSDPYEGPFTIEKNTTVRAACIFNGVLSDEVTLVCKVPSTPRITFNASTKTVTITGENTILYTTDGSDVRKKDTEYKGPFKITQTTTVKAKAYVGDYESDQIQLECVI